MTTVFPARVATAGEPGSAPSPVPPSVVPPGADLGQQTQVAFTPATAQRLRDLPKGDALVTAQLAGIMAAKRTSELVPLCHPLPLTRIDVACHIGGAGVEIEAVVETTAQTGVEMEALTAASIAALTVYDMAKAIDKQLVIRDIALVRKTKEPV